MEKMTLESQCLNCCAINEKSPVYVDLMGLHTACPKCESSYDIEVPGVEFYLLVKVKNTDPRFPSHSWRHYKTPVDEMILSELFPNGYEAFVIVAREGIIVKDECVPEHAGSPFTEHYCEDPDVWEVLAA